MKNNQIVILGPSGVGKTYALRKVFNIPPGFGTVSAITRPVITNGYQFLPEVSSSFMRRHEDRMWDFLNNGNTTITDVNEAFSFNLLNKLIEPKIILLTAEEDEIRERLSYRNTRNPKQADKSIRRLKRLKEAGYLQMTQSQLVTHLKDLIYGPNIGEIRALRHGRQHAVRG